MSDKSQHEEKSPHSTPPGPFSWSEIVTWTSNEVADALHRMEAGVQESSKLEEKRTLPAGKDVMEPHYKDSDYHFSLDKPKPQPTVHKDVWWNYCDLFDQPQQSSKKDAPWNYRGRSDERQPVAHTYDFAGPKGTEVKPGPREESEKTEKPPEEPIYAYTEARNRTIGFLDRLADNPKRHLTEAERNTLKEVERAIVYNDPKHLNKLLSDNKGNTEALAHVLDAMKTDLNIGLRLYVAKNGELELSLDPGFGDPLRIETGDCKPKADTRSNLKLLDVRLVDILNQVIIDKTGFPNLIPPVD